MVTVKDIAEKVDVSATTVSIVINGKAEERGITQATQDKIRAAMKELGYQPNLSARRLRSREDAPTVIGFFWPADFRLSILASFLNSFSSRIRETAFNCQLVVQTYENNRLRDFDDVIMKGTYNAVVIGGSSTEDQQHLESLTPPVPVVLINRDSGRYTTVGVDNEAMGRLAAEQFAGKGYREVAVFASRHGFPASNRRVVAFLDQCAARNISVPEEHIYRDDSSADGGYRMGAVFAAKAVHPRAVFCDSDSIAFGALRALQERNIRVPADLELLTIDITASELAPHASPPLSTVKMPSEALAARIIDLIQAQLKANTFQTEHVLLEPELVLRQSFARI